MHLTFSLPLASAIHPLRHPSYRNTSTFIFSPVPLLLAIIFTHFATVSWVPPHNPPLLLTNTSIYLQWRIQEQIQPWPSIQFGTLGIDFLPTPTKKLTSYTGKHIKLASSIRRPGSATVYRHCLYFVFSSFRFSFFSSFSSFPTFSSPIFSLSSFLQFSSLYRFILLLFPNPNNPLLPSFSHSHRPIVSNFLSSSFSSSSAHAYILPPTTIIINVSAPGSISF